MLNFLQLALNNNYIYIGIIVILVVVIIITLISIKKDKKNETEIEEIESPVQDENNKSEALIELEKVVGEMQKKLDEQEEKKHDIDSYEREQEETAVISYQELVKVVKSKENDSTPHNEVGMELADTNVIEEASAQEMVEGLIKETKGVSTESVENTKNENSDEPKRFQTTEFISPIYGKEPQGEIKNVEKNAPDKEVTMDDIIDEDFEEEDEFLDSLKNFRKNL